MWAQALPRLAHAMRVDNLGLIALQQHNDAVTASPTSHVSRCCPGFAAADVVARCARAVLELEQQPPNEALMAAAVAAIATPNAAAYEQHQASRQEAASSRQETKTAAATDGSTPSSSKREGKGAERRTKKEDSRGGSKKEQQQQQEGPRFPRSDDPAVQHKLRLLKSAPYTELRAGDWFCGQCGAHNYAFKQLCFR